MTRRVQCLSIALICALGEGGHHLDNQNEIRLEFHYQTFFSKELRGINLLLTVIWTGFANIHSDFR